MSKTHLYIIRHGETDWNRLRRIQGHLDSQLNERGIAQAQALAEHLPDLTYQALYSSDLRRAVHTAEFLAQRTGLDIQTKTCLRERDLGVLQGIIKEEANAQQLEILEKYITDVNYVIPQGESSRQFMQRCVDCMTELAKQHSNEHILVVTHGGVLGNMLKHTVGIPIQQARHFRALNTSFNWFVYDAGDWTLHTWGDVQHLYSVKGLDDVDRA